MLSKFSESDRKIYWTKHSREKMRQYQLSESRIRRVLRNPERKEVGIAPGTIAVMQVIGAKKNQKEIWVMYQITNSKLKVPRRSPAYSGTLRGRQNSKLKKIKIISAWRYPGRSPKGKPLPIPDDILEELNKIICSDI